ncbi:hypothetical protein RhiirA4_458869 [Rhizophagus irregularis]|uniref:RNase H type-1 domain-containing protein n=1 Tax=Rhizophagus irregularis TaxID=588596 RepID=A0A2I1GD37_9GLOM|nr:hypothetical protein RhiirA4_458869 [Rhizophagus irregularis]
MNTNSPPYYTFHGNTSFTPSSSTKAECFAILTALLICPPKSTINIYTDSQNSDAEAKKGLDVQPIFINPKFVPDATISSFWDYIGTIDRDIRKFSKTITDAQTFDSFTHNTKLQDTFSHHKLSDINWPVTQAWLKHNETSDTPINCKVEDDTISHLGFCSSVLPELNRIIKDFKANLYTKISLHADHRRMTFFLNQDLNTSPLLRPISDKSHPTYCCITSFQNSSSPRGPHQQTYQSIQHHKTTSNRINVTTANQIIFRHLVQTYRRYETMGTGGGYHYLEEETPQETMSPTD